jgi:hypothetical protein
MKIGIFFDSIADGLAAIDLLTGNGAEPTEVVIPGTPDPVLGVELDSRGFPWVADVHAGTKGKNKDGSWKAKKGVDDATRTAAEQAALAHLKATAAGPQTVGNIAVTVTAAPASVMPVAAPAMPMPAAMPMPGMPGMIPAAPLPPVSYDQLAEKYGVLAGAGKITAEYMGQLYAHHGVDPAALATDETGRRKIFDALIAIETAA